MEIILIVMLCLLLAMFVLFVISPFIIGLLMILASVDFTPRKKRSTYIKK